jgi:hypothetical protein
MITRKAQHVVVFALALGFVIVAVPRGVAASSISTIYSFGTITPDGAVPKGSLTYVNGLLFGRTTTTYKAAHDEPHYGAIFHFDPNNVASTYTIDHMFAGHDADDGDNPRHDAMTPFNGSIVRDHVGRWNTQQRAHLFDWPRWYWLPGALEPSQLHRRRVA